MFLTPDWQLRADWRIDLVSLLVGLLLGVLATLLWQRLQPMLSRQWQRLLSRVRQTVSWLRSGIEQRFREESAAYAQQFHLGWRWAPLADVFVEPQFLAPLPDVDPGNLPDWGATQLNYIWPELAAAVATPLVPEMSLRRLLQDGRRVILAGEAGAGKSTVLAQIAHLCATATFADEFGFLAPYVPALVHLSELDLAGETADPVTPLSVALQKRSTPLNRPGLTGLLQRKARAGHLLLLLDGWDELSPASRQQTVGWLQRLFTAYGDVRLFVAARLTGYGPLMPLGFTWTVLRPWRPQQVEAHGAAWTRVLANNAPPPVRYWAPGRTALETVLRFWLVVHGRQVKAVHQPARLPDLMSACLDAFFLPDQTAEERQITVAYWREVAFALLQTAAARLSPEELAHLAQQVAVDKPDESQRLTASLAASPLLVMDVAGGARFLCNVWRDFLAAQYVACHGLLDVAREHLTDQDWRGVIRFYVAEAGAGELAQEMLRSQMTSPLRNSLFQVASWLPDAPDAGEWRRETLILLGQVARQRTFAQVLRQRAAAAVVQTREAGTMAFCRQLLERTDPFLRQMGVVALSHLGITEPVVAVQLLTPLLEDGDDRVRQMTVCALAWLATPVAEKPLLTALIHGDDEVSRTAAAMLAGNGKNGLEILREALEDESVRVRRAALQGLSQLDQEWVEATLARLEREDPEWVVRTAASEALEAWRARRKASPWLPLEPKKQRWLVAYAARENRVVPDGDASLPFMVQVLTDAAQPPVRAAAALTLSQLPDESALPVLQAAVRDSDTSVQEAAFTALALVQRAFDL